MALKRLFVSNKVDVVFIYETLVVRDTVILTLKNLFTNWEYVSLEANGFSGGLVIGWTSYIYLSNSFVVFLGLCVIFHSHGLGK